MRKIVRDYAVIYIDDDGDTLKIGDYEDTHVDNYATNDMISDYYENGGYLQWNYYLIIPNDLLTNDHNIRSIEENDIYTRKYVLNREIIDYWVNKYFPEPGETRGKFKLLKGRDWKEAIDMVNQEPLSVGTIKLGSWYRDHSLLDTLSYMDELRASLIKDPSKTIVFYTHISNESSIAEKKFKTFMDDTKQSNLI